MNDVLFPWPAGRRAALSLTFDDGRPSQLDHALPILDRHGFKATFFVSLKNLDKRVEDWRRAAANGHEIGNHTLTHPCSGNFPFIKERALENYTLDRMEAELTGASEAIRDLFGAPPETFAYPCGNTFVGRGEEHRSYVPLVARHFLVGRHAFNECPNRPAFCDLALATSFDIDRASSEQIVEWVDRAIRENAWAIFMGHDVFPQARRQAVTTDKLESLCRLLKERGGEIWVETVRAVGRHVKEQRIP